MTGTGEDRAWTVRGRDFDCVYTASTSGGAATDLASLLVWQVRCTKVAARASAPFAGQLPFALTWDTASLQFSRRMMVHAHPANLEERLLWQGKTEDEYRGPRLPAVDEFSLRFRRGAPSQPPPPDPELPPDFVGSYAQIRANLGREGFEPRPPQKVRLTPPPGSNLASATLTVPVEVDRRYTVVVWTTHAIGPTVAVRISPTAVRAADLAPHGSTPMTGMLFSLGFRGKQATADIILSARESSVHTTYYVMLFEQRAR